ncbi:MAG: epimerase [Phycisphaerae bacterium]|nr:epimerase [Phycisphaerae bacterium]
MAEVTTKASGARRDRAILVTGAGGELGHGLLRSLSGQVDEHGEAPCVVAIDIRELPAEQKSLCDDSFSGDVCDEGLLSRLLASYEICEIYHLAALLSTRAEFAPETAHSVNVGGTINLLKLAAEAATSHGRCVKFFFPSSIAAYGLADLETKSAAGAVTEHQHCTPHTMYGCNKLSGENLGRYYAGHYRKLAKDRIRNPIDFRSIRFPGIISAETVPSGGTSDYGPEMIHAAVKGEPYACFVRPDTRIPFMTMPEAVDSISRLMAAPAEALGTSVYNVRSFSPSAEEFMQLLQLHVPGSGEHIEFDPDHARQSIVDSWPEDVDDSAARNDWGWEPAHDLHSAFEEYFMPVIKTMYGKHDVQENR